MCVHYVIICLGGEISGQERRVEILNRGFDLNKEKKSRWAFPREAAYGSLVINETAVEIRVTQQDNGKLGARAPSLKYVFVNYLKYTFFSI